jgi:hypothetical protein
MGKLCPLINSGHRTLYETRLRHLLESVAAAL